MTRKKPDPVKPEEEHRESQGVIVDQDFMNLLEASSLGSPAARRIRSLTPAHVAEELRKTAHASRDAGAEDAASPCQDTGDDDVPAQAEAETASVDRYLASHAARPRKLENVFRPLILEIADVSEFYESVASGILKAPVIWLDEVTLTSRKPSSVGEWSESAAGIEYGDSDRMAKFTPAGREEDSLCLGESRDIKAEVSGAVDQVPGYETKDYSLGRLYNARRLQLRAYELAATLGTEMSGADSRVPDPHDDAVTMVVVGRASAGKSTLVSWLLCDSEPRIGLWGPTSTGKTTFLPSLIQALDADHKSALAEHGFLASLGLRMEDSWLAARNVPPAYPQALTAAGGDIRPRFVLPSQHEPQDFGLWLTQRIENCEQFSHTPDPHFSIHLWRLVAWPARGNLDELETMCLRSARRLLCEQDLLSMSKAPQPPGSFHGAPLVIIQACDSGNLSSRGVLLNNFEGWHMASLCWEWAHEIGRQHRGISDDVSGLVWSHELLRFASTGQGQISNRLAKRFPLSRYRSGRKLILDASRERIHDTIYGGSSLPSSCIALGSQLLRLGGSWQLERPGSGQRPLAADGPAPENPAKTNGQRDVGTTSSAQNLDLQRPDGPVHHTIVALDIEGSTKRTDSVVMEGADGGAGPGARPQWRWDVTLSFAGAQRDYVEQVARALQTRGVRCFYDADEQIELWGKYLAEELPAIYGEQAAVVVVFVSAEYAARDWTRHERRAALARAVRERREYVLPARFDDTPLPGLLTDMVTVELRGRTPQQFAAMIADKLAALAIAAPAPPADAGNAGQDAGTARPAGAVRAGEADPRWLGVHAAISVPGVPEKVPPEYVLRDVDAAEFGVRAKVAAAAQRGGFVLLVGGSSVGKTRCAVEAVKALLPDWWLVHPAGPGEIAALAGSTAPRTVVWLDELQRYLDGEHGLTGGLVRALLNAPHPAVIIGTLWPDLYTAYTAVPASGGADPHAREREVLDLAAVVRIDPTFSPAEQGRARPAAARDPRLRIALESAGYGLTQTLAAAPQQVARWEDARTVSPYAWAVPTAALDVARLGARAPLSIDLLRAAAVDYCSSQQQAEAPERCSSSGGSARGTPRTLVLDHPVTCRCSLPPRSPGQRSAWSFPRSTRPATCRTSSPSCRPDCTRSSSSTGIRSTTRSRPPAGCGLTSGSSGRTAPARAMPWRAGSRRQPAISSPWSTLTARLIRPRSRSSSRPSSTAPISRRAPGSPTAAAAVTSPGCAVSATGCSAAWSTRCAGPSTPTCATATTLSGGITSRCSAWTSKQTSRWKAARSCGATDSKSRP